MTTPAQPAPPAADQGTPAAPAAVTQPEKTPPWADGDFDAERAWKKIQALEADKEKLAKRPVLDDAAKTALAEYEKLKAASQTDLEKAQGEATRWQTETEKWRGAAVAQTVKAFAGADFADPDDAVRNLDATKYLDAGGVIDEKAIKADLAALLEAKPHYRRSDGTSAAPRLPAPNPHQGSGANGRSAPDPAAEFAALMHGALK